MALKTFALIGLFLAAVVALAGFSACPHAEAMALQHGAVVAADAQTGMSGEHQCHHKSPSAQEYSVAWVRSIQTGPVITPPSPTHYTSSIVALLSNEAGVFAGKERPRPPSLSDGSRSGFAEIFARNSRLLI